LYYERSSNCRLRVLARTEPRRPETTVQERCWRVQPARRVCRPLTILRAAVQATKKNRTSPRQRHPKPSTRVTPPASVLAAGKPTRRRPPEAVRQSSPAKVSRYMISFRASRIPTEETISRHRQQDSVSTSNGRSHVKRRRLVRSAEKRRQASSARGHGRVGRR